MAPRTRSAMGAPIFVTLLACASTASATLNAMTYKGCFSSSQPLADQGPAQYQTSGYCQPICVGKNNAVLGLSNGTNCWCGDQLPASSSLVDDSKCNTPCNGYGSDNCGGSNYWSVYLTGTTNDVTNYGSSSDSSSSTTSSPSTQAAQATPVTTATPSVITSISPDHTVLVTVSASPTSSGSSNNNNGGGSGTSTAGIAAGVVVGVVGVAAIVGGVFFFLRRRRRQQAEDDYKRSAQVSDFMRGHGERKAPNTAYSQMSDSRLDPEIGRRNSVGSMADEQDYSRRILRVANPDSH